LDYLIGLYICLAKAKDANGIVFIGWVIGFLISVTISMYLLHIKYRSIPMEKSYAVWAVIGAAGSVIAGIIFFKDLSDFGSMFFLFLLISSIIGLKLSSKV
jgi:quaternary ammonium compound-resistance protein SugE